MFSFNQKILRVNLTEGSCRAEELEEKVYRKYLGGKGLALYFLMKEMEPGLDPLGPSNILVFSTGVATGVPLPGFSRYSVVSKSPLTGGFGEAEAGGFWGPELKFAGFDAIVIEGSSPNPVYLWVHDGEAEVRDASSVWGLRTKETQETIRGEVGDSLTRVALIGPAGEKMVRYACVLNDLKFANGRSGLGAVMGSKKLKAIAVRGHRKLDFKDPEKIQALARWFGESWSKHPGAVSRGRFGTAEMVLPLNADGILPTRNFIKGSFEGAEGISGEEMNNTITVGTEGCYSCPIRCKRVVKGLEPYVTDPSYGGPEYETIGAFGSLCEVGNISAVALANQICNAYGLDTISAGCSVAFAMECYENGTISLEDAGGLELRFGNADAMVRLTEMIARREGLGDVLAGGVLRASEKLGRGSERFALHVKGKEIPMHEPRGKAGLALQYALSASGADHMQAAHDPSFEKSVASVMALGVQDTVGRLSLGPDKVRLFKPIHLWWNLLDCLDVCKFTISPHAVGVFRVNHLVDIVNAATGWDASLLELMQASERALDMSRLFNLREGFAEADDRIPGRFFEPLQSGSMMGAKLSERDLEGAINTFYGMMGWSDEGKPGLAKLQELGISELGG